MRRRIDCAHYFAHGLTMARPKKLMVRRATNLTIDPDIRERAAVVALKRNESLSQMVERLLRSEIAQPQSALPNRNGIWELSSVGEAICEKSVIEELRRLADATNAAHIEIAKLRLIIAKHNELWTAVSTKKQQCSKLIATRNDHSISSREREKSEQLLLEKEVEIHILMRELKDATPSIGIAMVRAAIDIQTRKISALTSQRNIIISSWPQMTPQKEHAMALLDIEIYKMRDELETEQIMAGNTLATSASQLAACEMRAKQLRQKLDSFPNGPEYTKLVDALAGEESAIKYLKPILDRWTSLDQKITQAETLRNMILYGAEIPAHLKMPSEGGSSLPAALLELVNVRVGN